MNIEVRFGNKVRSYRKQLQISQEELGFRCNLSKNYISDVERGKRNVTLKVIERLAGGLEVSVPDLFL